MLFSEHFFVRACSHQPDDGAVDKVRLAKHLRQRQQDELGEELHAGRLLHATRELRRRQQLVQDHTRHVPQVVW